MQDSTKTTGKSSHPPSLPPSPFLSDNALMTHACIAHTYVMIHDVYSYELTHKAILSFDLRYIPSLTSLIPGYYCKISPASLFWYYCKISSASLFGFWSINFEPGLSWTWCQLCTICEQSQSIGVLPWYITIARSGYDVLIMGEYTAR